MIEGLSLWTELLFGIAFTGCILGFYLSNGKPKKAVSLLLLWSLGQSILAFNGFYLDIHSFPPRFALVLLPAFIAVGMGLQSSVIKWVTTNRIPLISTWSHSIRLPIELVLYGLYTHKMIPKLMTFEGRNFDVLIGITAILMGLFYRKTNLKIRLFWNLIGLSFILFIVTNAILSAELPFQQYAFDQPNRAVNYFPFVLLPVTIVPIVIWTHLSDIILLYRQINRENS